MAASETSLPLALIVKNEARCLARCLRSVPGVINEIVVVGRNPKLYCNSERYSQAATDLQESHKPRITGCATAA